MTPVIDSAVAEFQSTPDPAGLWQGAGGSNTCVVGWTRAARAVAEATPGGAGQPPNERIAYIDMARGLFLVLMASTHAMTLAGISATSGLGRWGLPRGWASTGLTMLCGFMIATLCRRVVDRAQIRARVVRRAKQLLVVMFASNVVMVTVRHLVSLETKPLFTLAWWWQFLVLGTEWSISGILLPIALFLLISPALIRMRDACLAIGVFFIAAGELAGAAPAIVCPMLTRTVVDLSHFLIIVTLALVLTQWRASQRALGFVSALGSCSLLTFLLHRIFEQMLNLGLKPLDVPREVVYAVCVSGGVFGSVGVILLRRRFAGWNRALCAVYL